MRRPYWLLLLLPLAASAWAREVAITIDDLPRGGDSEPPEWVTEGWANR